MDDGASDTIATGAGLAGADFGTAVFLTFAEVFLRLRYFCRRCRFSALLYCLLIVLYILKPIQLFKAL